MSAPQVSPVDRPQAVEPARPRRRIGKPAETIGVGLGVVVVPWALLSPDLAAIKIVGAVLMYVALSSAWNLLGGYAGYLNFGSAMFLGVGAYTTAIISTNTGIGPLWTLPAAALLAAVVGLLVGVPGFRLRGDYFAVATFVLTLAMQQLALALSITGGAEGLSLQSPTESLESAVRLFCLLFLGLAVVATLCCWVVERTRWFSALTAVKEDEDAAEVLGVPTLRVKLTAFVVGAALSGAVGCFFAAQLLFLEPTGAFDFQVSLAVVVAAVIGGKGTWWGPALGAIVTQLVLQQLLATVDGAWNQLIFGAVLVVVVLLLPRGIAGLVTKARGRRFGV
ncbi:branched-chain amino acid ABC transporter permease [Pseudonocardia sp. RS010]|uniref:branched-chain amino acid ABC transporter permease n=1 Tax=Pseudonocardia sp. RS010 TaxID=3385979 RepID=UPI00399F7081